VFGEAWRVGLDQSGCRARTFGLVRCRSCPDCRASALFFFCSVSFLLGVVKTNNCSVQLAAGCENEPLFAPGRWPSWANWCCRASDFTIVRYSAQYLEQHVLTYQPCPACVTNYCSLSTSWTPGRTEQKNPRISVGFVEIYLNWFTDPQYL